MIADIVVIEPVDKETERALEEMTEGNLNNETNEFCYVIHQ